jgi:hypothetical protein
LNILLSPAEVDMLNELSSERGLNVSDTVRHLIKREHQVAAYLTPLQCDAVLAQAAGIIPKQKENRK